MGEPLADAPNPRGRPRSFGRPEYRPELVEGLVSPVRIATPLLVFLVLPSGIGRADELREVAPLLKRYCFACHAGEGANGGVDLESIVALDRVDTAWETCESVVDRVESRAMPPEDEAQPTAAERKRIVDWYRDLVESIEPRPAVHRPRRLAVHEYRNTLASVLGFDPEVTIIEAEQTLAERSLVVKLMPTDPHGRIRMSDDLDEARVFLVDVDGRPPVRVEVAFGDFHEFNLAYHCGTAVTLTGTGDTGEKMVICKVTKIVSLFGKAPGSLRG